MLQSYLQQQTALITEQTAWDDGRLPLQVTTYLSNTEPPLDYVSSVRAVVFRGSEVLVVEDVQGYHFVVPGGRREAGEVVQVTLQREIMEETGWEVRPVRQLAVVHYHHLAPRPAGYLYPHPDFLHLIFLAEAEIHRPDFELQDEWVVHSEFRPAATALEMVSWEGQRVLLQAALEAMGHRFS